MKKQILIFFAGLLMFSSCNRSTVYQKYIDIDRITWNHFDVKTFTFDIKDKSVRYDLYISIRYITQVPVDYITTRFILYTPSGERRILEQKIPLKDENGKLLGEGMGDLWDQDYLVWKGFVFDEAGTCKVEISSTMSQADLPGIMQVGLIVKKG